MSVKIKTPQIFKIQNIIEQIYDLCLDVNSPKIYAQMKQINKMFYLIGKMYYDRNHNILAFYLNYMKNPKPKYSVFSTLVGDDKLIQ